MSLHHWESYYRGGALASCPMGAAASYTLELRGVWEEFFGALPDGARLLDVGTGNGAIALIASEVAAADGRHFEIHGTDLADIDPLRDVADGARLFRGIRFHPRVATEQLPFEAASFDAASGQYALEYTELPRALAELARVLKPGAQAQFILHHGDSVVAAKARESLQQSALVLEDTHVFRRLRRFLEAERSGQRSLRRTKDDLLAAMQRLQQAAAATDNRLTLDVTIDAVTKLVAARGQLSPATLESGIARVESDIRASVHRLNDLVRAGLDAAAVARLCATAEEAGLRCAEPQPQHHAGDKLVGWRLRMQRAAAD